MPLHINWKQETRDFKAIMKAFKAMDRQRRRERRRALQQEIRDFKAVMKAFAKMRSQSRRNSGRLSCHSTSIGG